MSTQTPTRGVPVELDKPRRLRFKMGAIEEFRKEFGTDTAEGFDLSGANLAKVLRLGLLHEDPAVTLEQVDDMVDMENLPEVLKALTKALGMKVQDPPKPSGAPSSTDGVI